MAYQIDQNFLKMVCNFNGEIQFKTTLHVAANLPSNNDEQAEEQHD